MSVIEQRVEGFPLSPQQRRLWRLRREVGEGTALRQRLVARVDAPVDTACLAAAARRVVERHEILRTRFETVPGMALPLQVVEDEAGVGLAPRVMAGAAPTADGETGLRVVADAAAGSLTLEVPALWSDATGLVNLLHELAVAYAAEAGGGSEGAGAPMQYADFAAWMNELLEADETAAGRRFWQGLGPWPDATGAPAGTGLAGLPLPPASGADGGDRPFLPRRLPVPLAGAVAATLGERAGELGVEAADLLLAAWVAWLGRVRGEAPPLLAVLADGRRYRELETALGPFSRSLPLRPPAADGSFADLARAVAEARGELGKWQESYDPALLDGGGAGTTPPLAFAWYAPPAPPADAPAWTVERLETLEEPFLLRLTGLERSAPRPGEPAVLAELGYDASRVVEDDAERLAAGVAACLAAVLESPARPVASLPVVGEAERLWLSRGGAAEAPAAAPPADEPVHRRFQAQAAAHPERTAVVCGDTSWSYGELEARANRLARHLRRRGVGPETPVVLSLERSARMVEALLAVLEAGGFYVPVDPALPAERRAALLAESGAEVVLDAAALDGLEAELADLSSESPAVEVPMDGLVYRLYTSGSTGRPKGVEVTHGNLAGYVASWLARVEPPEAAAYATVSSLAADLGNTAVFPALAGGGTLHVLPLESVYDPAVVAAYLAEHAVDVLKIVPSHLSALLAGAPELEPPAILVCGGEALSWELAAEVRERRPDIRLWNHYGPTEATVGVLTGEVVVPSSLTATVPLGTALTGEAAYVVDAGGALLPAWAAGELVLGGRGIARGYAGRPAATAERFLPDPFAAAAGARLYRTGDRARALSAGGFEFLGRLDHQVKIRGFRVELGEVEAALRRQPGVAEAVVVLGGDAAGGPAAGEDVLVAYLVAEPGHRLDPGELRRAVAEVLPEYMVPRTWLELDELPRLATGKVDRRALPAPDDAAPVGGGAGGGVAPRGLFEEMVADLWAEVLGVEAVGVHDDFFALGGHSLLATQIVSRLRQSFQVEVPVRTLFDHPTVAALVARVEELRRDRGDGAGEAPPLEPRSRQDEGRAESQGPPLSFAQARLWFLDQLERRHASYNIAGGLRLSGRLDVPALTRAVADVVRRHEVLRTRFPAEDGRPFQQVLPPAASAAANLPRADLGALPAARADAELARLAAGGARRPFDLASGPLLRNLLVALPDAAGAGREHGLLFAMHHIVSDGWSMGLLIRELSALYTAFAAGRPSPLPPLPIQYADFAVWQREWLRGGELERQVAFWKRRLAGAPPALALPTDRPYPAQRSFRGRRQPFRLEPELVDRLRDLARGQGATLFMVLLAAFQLLLSRYARQRDVVVGAPVANRNRAELEPLIGFFVNSLVLRTDLSGEPSFAALVDRVRDVVLDAYAHQDVPFEKLVDELEVRRDLGRTPLFQAVFVLQTAARDELSLPGLELAPLSTDSRSAKFDLTLALAPLPGGAVQGSLEYASDLFDRSTVERLLGHFGRLLEGVAADPTAVAEDVDLLSAEERRQIAAGSAAREVAVEGTPLAGTLDAAFAAHAAARPGAPALTHEGETVTYGELERRANRLARRLVEVGVTPGDLVGLCLERSPEIAVGILGILKAGAAYLPLDPAYPRQRLLYMLTDSGARVVVTADGAADGLDAEGVALERVDLRRDDDALAAAGDTAPAVPGDPHRRAYVIYTSGSTGRPKGVEVTHRHVARLFAATDDDFGFGADDVWTLFHSSAFDFSVWELWGALLHGGRLVVVPYWVSRSPEDFLRLLVDEGVTVLNQTPSAFRSLVFAEQAAGGSDLALRHVVFGGEALDPASLAPWYALHPEDRPRLINMYGITETTVHVTHRPLTAADATLPASRIGRALGDLSLHVLDRRGRPLPVGMPGEIHVGGAGPARGYLGRPALTAERFLPDPFGGEGGRLYRTGDLARRLPDGDVEYLGRVDHQVQVYGFRVELGEIEAALAAHPAVREAVVLERPEDAAGGRLGAWLVAAGDDGAPPTTSELRAFLAERLPDYMLPAVFVVLDAIPLTENGKVDRAALLAAEPAAAPAAGDPADAEPGGEAERILAGIWAGLLGRERVGVHDNFFELGGDSILSIQVVARARKAGLHLTPRDLFQHQTVAELARVAGGGEAAPAAGAEQGELVGELPLTPIQRWFLDAEPAEPHHFNQAVLLTVPADLDAAALGRAVGAVWRHHDALRLRVRRGDDGWRQSYAAAGAAPYHRVDLSALAPAHRRAALEAASAAVQGSLSLADGPLGRALWFGHGGDPGRLLWVIHHLAVDGVSWRILLEDLEAAHEAASRPDRDPAAALPAKTTSYRAWAGYLEELAGSPELAADAAYWQGGDWERAVGLPGDERDEAAEGAAPSEATRRHSLSGEATAALLGELPRRLHAQVDEVLLAALGEVLAPWAGGPVQVDLEGHGREEAVLAEAGLPEADLSRTVGWFTSIHPVLVGDRPDGGDDEDDATAAALRGLARTKERLRGVPRHGLGFALLRHLGPEEEQERRRLADRPPAEVAFNYLGQLDRVLAADATFAGAAESVGPQRSPRQRPRHRLTLTARVAGGRLEVAWRHDPADLAAATVARLAEEHGAVLERLVAATTGAEDADGGVAATAPLAAAYVPSDFPLAGVEARSLPALLAGETAVEDLYPLSPLQEGLLFHSLYEPEPGLYYRQVTCTLRGDVDVDALRGAWQRVVDRHSILRSSFLWRDTGEPLQRVAARAPVRFVLEDWREIPQAEQERLVESFLTHRRRDGFELDRAPLIHLSLLRLDDDLYRFVWGHHHLLLDGWSTPVVVQEVFRLYAALAAGDPDPEAGLPDAAPYGAYIAWLAQRDEAAAEAFWRNALEGYEPPPELSARRGEPAPGEPPYDQRHRLLEAAASGELVAWARRHRLTLNTVVQGVWAVALGRLTGRDDVVFGAAVSGRPSDLAGVESMVGVFLNTQPVRVRLAGLAGADPGAEAGAAELVTWLGALQERQSEARRFEHCSLADVQVWSGVPRRTPLFESFLTFQNYPVDDALGDWRGNVEVDDYLCIERVNFPLSLVATPGDRIKLELKYRTARFDDRSIDDLLDDLCHLLARVAAGDVPDVAALRRELDERARHREGDVKDRFQRLRRSLKDRARS